MAQVRHRPPSQSDLRRSRVGSSILVACLLFALFSYLSIPTANGYTLNYHDYDSLQFTITSPASMIRNITYAPSLFGSSIINPPDADGISREIVLAYPDPTACTDLRDPVTGQAHTQDGRSYDGKMMLILRGDCTFGQKAVFAQAAGAAIALLYSCSPAAPSLCAPDRVDVYSGPLNVTITTIMIDWEDGSDLAKALALPACSDTEVAGTSDVSTLASTSTSATANCSVWAYLKGTGPISPLDRAALTRISQDVDFQYETDKSGQAGPLPPFSFIQNVTLDPCLNRVAGMWCEGGRVKILDLDSMNLTGILSPSFGDLTGLQQLILSSNNFYCTTLKCTFSQLTDLRVLGLFHMGLESFEPNSTGCLSTLTNLEFVDASFNRLSDLPDSMKKWTSMKALDVSNNGIITQLGDDWFKVFSQLQYLSLENNAIFLDVTGMNFRDMVSLNYFYAGANLIQGVLSSDAFDHLPNLLELELNNNNILGRLPLFNGTNNLVHLDLSFNYFIGNCSNWWMPNLLYLSLSTNGLVEPQEHLPSHLQSLQYLDLSQNYLTMPPAYTDIGSFLFALMPLPLQTVHLEGNQFAGDWGNGFLQTYPQLSHVYISHNLITSVPDDIFQIGNNALIDLDVSSNKLVGNLPSIPPPSTATNLRFDDNPDFRDPNGQLPSWATLDPLGNYYQPANVATYLCSSLIGITQNSHLNILLDPAYFGYQGCKCNRGTYGSPPSCTDIPAVTRETPDGTGQGTFTDGLFGDQRFFQGLDTSFLIGMSNLSTSHHHVHAQSARQGTIRLNQQHQPILRLSELLSNGTPGPLPPTPPGPSLLVRAIYITFALNLDEFSGADDSISVYSGGLDLRGERVVYWQGTDTSFSGNIDLGGAYPPMTVTILGTDGVVNFRSRHAEGTHFNANYTLSADCPPNYIVSYDNAEIPGGYCALPPGSGSSATIILLLVTSVIIGVLALCLLGQKMSTIQGLINGPSHVSTRTSRREQAQEIYGPVLSVEDSWRRQLKRDMVKEGLMLLLELVGYISNWIVVIQEIRNHVGPVLNDKFLVGYGIVVVCSTVTGFVSVYARVRVIREIYRELTLGVAVVPTIDMLLHHIKSGKHKSSSQQQHPNGASSHRQSSHHREASTPGRGGMHGFRHDDISIDESLGFNRQKSNALRGFGQPLLGDSPMASDSPIDVGTPVATNPNFFLAADSQPESSWDPSMATINSGASARGRGTKAKVKLMEVGRSSSSQQISGIRRSPSVMSVTSSASSEELKVRLSSKDPNVQLAWVQRSISTTKLTSFNLIFSTIPFLILNQIQIFQHDSINSDWALQLSSLFASMLLGVKLLRILALSDLYQRRNELVFEVITNATNNTNSSNTNKRFPDHLASHQSSTPGVGGGSNTGGILGHHSGSSASIHPHTPNLLNGGQSLLNPLPSPPNLGGGLGPFTLVGSVNGGHSVLSSEDGTNFLSGDQNFDPSNQPQSSSLDSNSFLLAPAASLASTASERGFSQHLLLASQPANFTSNSDSHLASLAEESSSSSSSTMATTATTDWARANYGSEMIVMNTGGSGHNSTIAAAAAASSTAPTSFSTVRFGAFGSGIIE